MWLPKDERRLLAGLYRLIGEPKTRKGYRYDSLGRLLDSPRSWRQVSRYGQQGDTDDDSCSMEDMKKFKLQVHGLMGLRRRVATTVKTLESRNLIRFSPHESEDSVVFVELSVKGFDMGRKYASFLERSGLWFREYRHHWLWIPLSYAAGVATPLLIDLFR